MSGRRTKALRREMLNSPNHPAESFRQFKKRNWIDPLERAAERAARARRERLRQENEPRIRAGQIHTCLNASFGKDKRAGKYSTWPQFRRWKSA